MIKKMTVVGGAAYRQPTPRTGDIDIQIESPIKVTEEWKTDFSTPEILTLVYEVDSFITELWGEPIELDLALVTEEWAVIFRDGMPAKRLPRVRFKHQYCL